MASRLLLVALALLCCASLGQGLTFVNQVDPFLELNLANSRFFLDTHFSAGFFSNAVSLPASTSIPIGGESVDRDCIYAAQITDDFSQVIVALNSDFEALTIALGNGAAWIAVDYDGADGTPPLPTNPVEPDVPQDNPDVTGLNATDFFTEGGAVGIRYEVQSDHLTLVELHLYEDNNPNSSFSSFLYPEPPIGTSPPIVVEQSYSADFSPAINFDSIGAFRILVFTTIATDFEMVELFTFTNEISGRVYVDCNTNLNDDAEAAVSAYTVNLFECGSGIVFDTTLTDINGNYVFGVTDTLGGNPACYDVCIDTNGLSSNGLIYEPNVGPTAFQTCYEDIQVFDSIDNDFGMTDTVIVCSDTSLDCSDNIGSAPTNVGVAGSPTITTLGPCVTTFTFSDTVVVAGTCNGQVSRLFSTTDDNAAQCTQNIAITDTTGPTLSTSPSASVSIDCAASTSVADNGEPTFTDDCNGPPTVLGPTDSVAPLCPGTEQITRTWQAVDLCDNSGESFTQTITTTDTTNPTVAAPADFTGPCNSVASVGTPTGSDDCSTVSFPSPSFSDSAVSSGPCGQSFVRTWVGQDGCGNTDSDTQLITLADTQAPTLTPPPSTTVSCNESTAEGAVNIGTVSNVNDDCTAVTVLPATDVVNVIDACNTVITRTWVAQDTCSTTSDTTVTQTITVVDDIAPVLVIPGSPLTVTCTTSTSTTALGTATATDDCQGPLTPVFTDTIDPSSTTCRTTLSRAWTVTDSCVGPVTLTQIVIFTDTAPPTFTVPGPVSLGCLDDTSPANTGSPTNVADDCSSTNAPTSTDTITSDGCTETITRRWSVADVCLNPSPVQIQILTVTDTQAPTVTAPANVNLECGSDTSSGSTGGPATVTDDCNSPTTPVPSDAVTGDSCTTTITRTWTSSDGCQIGSSVQIIVVDDSQPPSITIPAPENVELCTCGLNCGTPATASDCQATVALTSSDSGPTPGPCGVVTRTWTANDNCGQTNTATQTFTLVDSTAPVYNGNLVSPLNLECGADTSVVATGIAQFSDCTSVVVTMSDNTVLQSDCDQQYERTFFGTNECGGQSRFTQEINVSDNLAPTFLTFPPTVTVECATSTDPFVISSVPTGSDACQPPGNVALTFSDTVSTFNSCIDIISRTWTISDVCGNQRTQTQNVNVEDSTNPTIVMPSNPTTECTGGNPASYTPATFGSATGSDACDPVSIVATFVDDPFIGGSPCSGTFGRTWTVTDTCGLSTSSVQVFTIEDTTPAQFLVFPGAASVNCGASIDPAFTGEPTVTEACNSVTLTFSDGTPSGTCPATFARTWSVDDGCNPPTTSVQILSVNDNVDPIFTNFPADNNLLECGAPTDPSSTGAPGSSDSCTTASAPTFVDTVVSAPNDCVVTISRTWSTTDSCANTRTQLQTLTYTDTTAPPVGTFPADSTIECGQTVPAPSATVGADACAPGTESVSVLSTSQTGVCTQIFTRVYQFSDSCGNSLTRTETVTIEDTTPPTIGTVADTTVDCNDPRPVVLPSASDCDNVPSITFTDVETSDNCPNDSITRTFTAEDWCGLTSQSVTTITITNNLPPVVVAPQDDIVECGDSSDPSQTGTATVSHPCNLGFTLTFSDSSNGGDLCSELVTRTWSASDICGNTGTDVQILDISDNIEPDFTCFPDDVSVLCSESTDPFNTGGFPCATDECQGVVCLITYFDSAPVELTPIGDCPGDLVYTRTWLADDACGLQVSQNQLITVIFHEQAEDCPAEPCVAAPCELCECPVEAPCNCCAMGGITACSAVPCNPVPCSAVPCTAVDCEACPASSGTTVSPAQPCGPEVPCIPNLRFVHNNDDGDGDQRSTYVVDFYDDEGNLIIPGGATSYNYDDEEDDAEDDNSGSLLTGGVLALLLPLMVLFSLN